MLATASLISNADGQDVGLLGTVDGARGKVVEGEGQTYTPIIKLFEALHGGLLSSLSGV